MQLFRKTTFKTTPPLENVFPALLCIKVLIALDLLYRNRDSGFISHLSLEPFRDKCTRFKFKFLFLCKIIIDAR